MKIKKRKRKDNIEKRLNNEWKNILFNIIFAGLNTIFVILFYKDIILTTILVGILSIIGLIKWKSKLTFILFVSGGLLGAGGEMICVKHGIWVYSFVNIFNIPLWLFLVWGNAIMFIYQMAVEIRKLGVKK